MVKRVISGAELPQPSPSFFIKRLHLSAPICTVGMIAAPPLGGGVRVK